MIQEEEVLNIFFEFYLFFFTCWEKLKEVDQKNGKRNADYDH